MHARSHQTGNVGHVHHQIGAYGIGHFPELGEVNGPGIGAGTGNDDLGLAGLCGLHQGIIVDGFRLVPQTVGDDVEIFTGDIHRASVTEVSTVSQIHAQNRVTGLGQGKERCQVGVGAGVGLHVGVVTAKELAGTLAGDFLRDVHGEAAAVVALAGIALGVLIGQAGAHRQHHGGADDILRGDQLDVPPLAVKFRTDGCADLGVILRDKFHGFLNQGNRPPFQMHIGIMSNLFLLYQKAVV